MFREEVEKILALRWLYAGRASALAGVGIAVLAFFLLAPTFGVGNPFEKATSEAVEQRVVVRAEAANVRGDPSLEAPVVGVVTGRTPLTVLSRNGDWVRVRMPDLPGGQGWIHYSVLTEAP